MSDSISIKKIHTDAREVQVRIETDRLILVSYDDKYKDKAYAVYQDEVLTKHYDQGRPKTPQEIEDWIAEGKRGFVQGMPLGLFAIHTKASDEFVGFFDLYLDSTSRDMLEVGCILTLESHSKGYCTELVQFMASEFASYFNSIHKEINQEKINWIMATAHPNNIGSIRLIEKIGMQKYYEGPRFGKPRLWFRLPV